MTMNYLKDEISVRKIGRLILAGLLVAIIGWSLWKVQNVLAAWTSPVNLSNDRNTSWFPEITVDSTGTIHVPWGDTAKTNFEVLYSKGNGAVFSAPVDLSNTAGASSLPSIAVDGTDKLHLVWQDDTDPAAPGGIDDWDVWYSRWNGTSWTTPINLTDNTSVSVNPVIVSDGTGRLHLFWTDNLPFNNDIFYMQNSGGVWSAPVNLTNNPGDSDQAAAAADALGNVHLVTVVVVVVEGPGGTAC